MKFPTDHLRGHALTNADRARMLIEARQLVTRVAFSLNVKGSKCTACPATHYQNLEEFRAHQKLSSVETKLQQQAEDFQRKSIRDIQDGKHEEPENHVAQGLRSASAAAGDTSTQGKEELDGSQSQ